MRHQNQPAQRPNVSARDLARAGATKLLLSSREKRAIWVFRATAERFAFAWLSAFSVCVRTRISTTQWSETWVCSREAAQECSPRGKPWGKVGKGQAPAGRQTRSYAHTSSAEIDALKSTAPLAAATKTNLSSRLRAT